MEDKELNERLVANLLGMLDNSAIAAQGASKELQTVLLEDIAEANLLIEELEKWKIKNSKKK